jgi:transcriptional regulator with XRE-family HTH domain
VGGDDVRMERSEAAASGEIGPGMSVGRRLRRARMARQWSQVHFAQRMRDVAASHGRTATLPSLKIMISKWENGAMVPNEYNRHLLAATLQVTVADLGLSEDPDFVW